jgi:DNA-directed RNA polymerase specialized sigma24 family protein
MREIVTLCALQGLSMKEAVQRLRLSVAAVKSRLRFRSGRPETNLADQS